MYNFIFWVLYTTNIEDGPFWARVHASMIVIVAFFMHFILVISIIKKYLFDLYTSLPIDFLNNKPLLILLFIISIILLFRYYNQNRIDKIVHKYSMKESYMIFNKIIVAFIVFIPIILIIIILTHLPKP
jgi:archaellum biogenesis protein FlaJ (TadC family)